MVPDPELPAQITLRAAGVPLLLARVAIAEKFSGLAE
jgi:hypothetical protein